MADRLIPICVVCGADLPRGEQTCRACARAALASLVTTTTATTVTTATAPTTTQLLEIVPREPRRGPVTEQRHTRTRARVGAFSVVAAAVLATAATVDRGPLLPTAVASASADASDSGAAAATTGPDAAETHLTQPAATTTGPGGQPPTSALADATVPTDPAAADPVATEPAVVDSPDVASLAPVVDPEAARTSSSRRRGARGVDTDPPASDAVAAFGDPSPDDTGTSDISDISDVTAGPSDAGAAAASPTVDQSAPNPGTTDPPTTTTDPPPPPTTATPDPAPDPPPSPDPPPDPAP